MCVCMLYVVSIFVRDLKLTDLLVTFLKKAQFIDRVCRSKMQ